MPSPSRRRPISARLLIPVVVIALLLVFVGPMVFDRFTMNVLTRSMIYAMLAITVDLLWGYTGILTFGQAAFFGVGAYATAMVLTYLGSGPEFFALALLMAVLIPMVLGVAVGWLSFYYASTPLYASVISLVLPIVVTQLVFAGGNFTGSSSGLVGFPTLSLGSRGFFQLSAATLVVVGTAAWIFVRSDAGRVLMAIRDNEARCAYLGLNPQSIKIRLTAVLAGIAGLAGFLFANVSNVVAPENTGFVFGTELVVWTALGGRGTVLGPILGTIGIDYLSASLSGELPFIWQLLIGTLFVVMIILLPNGLAALAVRLVPSRFRRRKAVALKAGRDAARRDATAQPLLAVEGLEMAYGSHVVLKGIDLVVEPGELVSLVGPNGAGKTTLMRALSDGTIAIGGRIRIGGQDVDGMTPDRIVALGVGRKFQVASVFESMTVAECLRMARTRLDPQSPFESSADLVLPPAARDILVLTGLDAMLSAPLTELSHGQKQALELAMVVSLEPRLILLDEPTAGLTKVERTTIGSILIKLTRELGFAVVLVEHDLDFVRDISSRIVVLHQGKLVLDGSVEDVVNSETVRTIYSGGVHA